MVIYRNGVLREAVINLFPFDYERLSKIVLFKNVFFWGGKVLSVAVYLPADPLCI